MSRSWTTAFMRGLRLRCPNCGEGKLFTRYIRANDSCAHCKTSLGHIRADDAPPYFTLFIVGHIIVPLALVGEQLYHPPIWLQLAFWLPIMLIAILVALPFVKGATLGVMYHLGLSGSEN